MAVCGVGASGVGVELDEAAQAATDGALQVHGGAAFCAEGVM